MADRILATTPFLRLIDRDGWTFVERPNSQGVVTIIPLTAERRLLLVEQFRAPLGRKVIEFPAGLMGDEPGHENEDPVASARRELIEETGYEARDLELVATTATSPGMANELVHFILAWNLVRVGAGGGIDNENIAVHEVPIADARAWLREQEGKGLVIAAKVFAGLYFASERWG
ncbi:MAG TPA: NUDIX hydrolase [Polyangia bacterium]